MKQMIEQMKELLDHQGEVLNAMSNILSEMAHAEAIKDGPACICNIRSHGILGCENRIIFSEGFCARCYEDHYCRGTGIR